MNKLLASTAVASMLMALPALAQTTSPTPSAPSTTTAPRADTTTGQLRYFSTYSDEMRMSKLIGTTVRNAAGETIGDVNEILLDKNGKVAAVVIGVGGFLGMGEREVALSFESIQSGRDANGNNVLTVNATKDSLKNAPAWMWPRT
jgi:sporulation protein YlmC with PRC-barrel domain